MTWYYDINDDGSTMDVYEADSEFTGLITTLENDGSGLTVPDDVRAVMRETWEEEASPGKGNSPVMSVRAGNIIMDMVTGDIQEGTP